MRVLVIGANGGTGFRVVKKLVAHPEHTPVAMVRDAGQEDRFAELRVETIVADLEHPIDHAMDGCDAVIFAAGSGSRTGKDKTVLVDHLGAIRSMVAALRAGASRYIMLSGLDVDRDYEGSSIPHWRRAKGRADHFLRTMPRSFEGRGLDYTIVCPGGLTDEERGDAIQIIAPSGTGRTSRENLAGTLAGCLDEPATIGKTFGVIDGEQQISAALENIAEA